MLKIKRPYLKHEWCQRVLDEHEAKFEQENGRMSFWAYVPEMEEVVEASHPLRVVTLADGETIRNAYPDRDYARRQGREE